MQDTPLLKWLLIWLPAQIVSLVATIFLFTLGLILIEFLVYPLALGVSALLTGLTAMWASNRLIKDGRLASAKAVVLRCEAAAAALALVLIVASASGRAPSPPIIASSAAAVLLAILATYAAVTQRFPPQELPDQRRRVLLWLLLALLAIPTVILVADQFGWAGA
ncbi:MAG: hypothetical protein ACK2UK_04080 [Candidatus Promineifilaceae bacterium]|jgi:hypothetical protein